MIQIMLYLLCKMKKETKEKQCYSCSLSTASGFSSTSIFLSCVTEDEWANRNVQKIANFQLKNNPPPPPPPTTPPPKTTLIAIKRDAR